MLRCTIVHDISCGHRLCGHEGPCANLHGHNYRFHFVCQASDGGVDSLGRVVDFCVIKDSLCAWLDTHWDHRLLLWADDPLLPALAAIDPSVIPVPCNPTAENMARHLGEVVAPQCLAEAGAGNVAVVSCTVEETGDCSATWEREHERPNA